MTSDRAYRKAKPKEEALAELRRGSGTQFDPVMVSAFLRALDRRPWEPPPSVPAPPDAVAVHAIKDHDDPTSPIQVVSER
jgi:HD-GYP domain-containing protein (c-di-GMP phosphodiesterase class II)